MSFRVKKSPTKRAPRKFRYTYIIGSELPLNLVSRLRGTEITLTIGEFLNASPYALALISKLLIYKPTKVMKRAVEKRKLKKYGYIVPPPPSNITPLPTIPTTTALVPPIKATNI